MYRFFFNADSTGTMQYGDSNKWHTAATTEGIIYKTVVKSLYYSIEVAIPWKMLGLDSAPAGNTMRINIENVDRTDTDIATEIIPETLSKQSWSWMEFRLRERAAEKQITAETAQVSTTTAQGRLYVKSDRPMTGISLTSFNGMMLYNNAQCGTQHSISLPATEGGVLRIAFADGNVVTRKVLFQ